MAFKKTLIIGGGPSLNGVDFKSMPRDDFFIIGTNKAYRLIMPDILFWFDYRFWEQNKDELISLPCRKATSAPINAEKQPAVASGLWRSFGVEYYYKDNKTPLDFSDRMVLCGNNSGHLALNLAYKLGAREIYLLGFDMKADQSGNCQFHNEHKIKTNPITYDETMLPKLNKAAEMLRGLARVYNCNPDSALRAFPFADVPW